MSRSLARWSFALALIAVAASCAQSAEDRAQRAALRVKEQATTRESEEVRRLATPQIPQRILYHAPTDLSDSNAVKMNATIVGENRVPQPTEPAVHSGAPPEKLPARKP